MCLALQAAAPEGTSQGFGGGGTAALRAQEVVLRVSGQHLTDVGRGVGEHVCSSNQPEGQLLRVHSLLY